MYRANDFHVYIYTACVLFFYVFIGSLCISSVELFLMSFNPAFATKL